MLMTDLFSSITVSSFIVSNGLSGSFTLSNNKSRDDSPIALLAAYSRFRQRKVIKHFVVCKPTYR